MRAVLVYTPVLGFFFVKRILIESTVQSESLKKHTPVLVKPQSTDLSLVVLNRVV